MATKTDELKQTFTPETMELFKQFKALFTDDDAEALKKEERELRAKERAQKAEQQAKNKAQEDARLASMEAIKNACTHQRDDGTWNLQGQRCCDGVIRFMCPQCGGKFAPGDPQYETLLKYIKKDKLGNARQVV
jgi:hypothetical protein